VFVATSAEFQAIAAVVVLGLFIVVPAYGVGRLAQRKGRSFAAWMAASVILSWAVTLIPALVVRPRRSGG
jgi:hypothetical protein